MNNEDIKRLLNISNIDYLKIDKDTFKLIYINENNSFSKEIIDKLLLGIPFFELFFIEKISKESFINSLTLFMESSSKNIVLYPKIFNGKKEFLSEITLTKEEKSSSIILTIKDISQLISFNEKYNKLQNILNNTLNNIDLGLLIFDLNLNIIFKNSFLKEFKFNINNLKLFINEFNKNHEKIFLETINNKKYKITISYFFDKNTISGYTLYILEITDILSLKDKLIKLEDYNQITGLPNKNLLEKKIKSFKFINKDIFLVLLNINSFKDINKNYSKEEGDFLLKEISFKLNSLFKNNLRINLFFIPADNFYFIIEDQSNLNLFLKKIDKLFNNEIDIGINSIKIDYTISISKLTNNKLFSTLFREVDIALYYAKDKKNKINFFNKNLKNKFHKKIFFEKNIKTGLFNKEFELFYQPQINSKNNELIGFESLIRWVKNNKLISPNDFIPISEEKGFIIDIGYFILEEAFKQAYLWDINNYDYKSLSINLSPKQLNDKSLIKYIKNLFNEYKISPKKISFEITETCLFDNPNKSISILNELKKLGVKILIDDFGTGFSSLSYLKKLPIDKLKIDKIFIDNIENNKEDILIIKTIIDLANNFNLDIIAEGVENENQLNILKEMNCFEIQGYLFSKPLNSINATKFISTF